MSARALAELARMARRLVALPLDEQGLLLQAALLLPTVALVQRALPFKRWRPLLTHRRPPSRARAGDVAPASIARALQRAKRGVPGKYECLPTAYAGHLLLHHHGHASTVRVGVSRDAAGKVEAHAWVELEGKVLIGEVPDLARFVPFPALSV